MCAHARTHVREGRVRHRDRSPCRNTLLSAVAVTSNFGEIFWGEKGEKLKQVVFTGTSSSLPASAMGADPLPRVVQRRAVVPVSGRSTTQATFSSAWETPGHTP